MVNYTKIMARYTKVLSLFERERKKERAVTVNETRKTRITSLSQNFKNVENTVLLVFKC